MASRRRSLLTKGLTVRSPSHRTHRVRLRLQLLPNATAKPSRWSSSPVSKAAGCQWYVETLKNSLSAADIGDKLVRDLAWEAARRDQYFDVLDPASV